MPRYSVAVGYLRPSALQAGVANYVVTASDENSARLAAQKLCVAEFGADTVSYVGVPELIQDAVVPPPPPPPVIPPPPPPVIPPPPPPVIPPPPPPPGVPAPDRTTADDKFIYPNGDTSRAGRIPNFGTPLTTGVYPAGFDPLKVAQHVEEVVVYPDPGTTVKAGKDWEGTVIQENIGTDKDVGTADDMKYVPIGHRPRHGDRVYLTPDGKEYGTYWDENGKQEIAIRGDPKSRVPAKLFSVLYEVRYNPDKDWNGERMSQTAVHAKAVEEHAKVGKSFDPESAVKVRAMAPAGKDVVPLDPSKVRFAPCCGVVFYGPAHEGSGKNCPMCKRRNPAVMKGGTRVVMAPVALDPLPLSDGRVWWLKGPNPNPPAVCPVKGRGDVAHYSTRYLPVAVFDRLDGFVTGPLFDVEKLNYREYPNRLLAMDALCRAAGLK